MPPKTETALVYRASAGDAYTRVLDLTRKTVASALIYLPSHASEFRQSELRPYLDKYVRGFNGIDAEQRVKAMKPLWDATGSEFASRHELHELNYSGSYERGRLDNLNIAEEADLTKPMKGFVGTCLSEYNLDGWIAPDLIMPVPTSS